MKKFAWLFAALSLCACSFTACGDDDDDSSDKKKNGEACEVAADCESDYCSADKTCAAKPAADDKANKGESCADKECAEGLECNSDKICADKAVADDKANKGESCADKECAEGLECNSDKICADKAVADDKANKGESCADKECAEGLECNSDKICADKAVADDKAKEGESCADKDCADGLKCNADSKVCEKDEAAADKKSEGEACEKSEECDDGLVCTEVDGNKICLSNEGDEDACVAATHVITCGNPEGVATSYICENSVITPKACNENERCDEGKGCVSDEIEDIECNEMISCADSSKICVNNKCVDNTSTDECDDLGGAKKCADGKVCSAGKCIDTPAVNADCDESFVAVCDGAKTIYYCDNKKVKKTNCDSGMACYTRPDKAAECAEACTGALVEGSVQYADCDPNTNTAYNYICAKDYYGNALMAFENIEACGSKTCSANGNVYSGEMAVCK